MKNSGRFHPTMKLFTTLALSAALCSPAAFGSEKDRYRQTEKLEKKGAESLSVQSLVDIYNSCLNTALGIEEGAGTTRVSKGDLSKHCHEEAKELRKRTSDSFVQGIDELYEEKADNYLLAKTQKSSDNLSSENIVSKPTKFWPQRKSQVNSKRSTEQTAVSAGPLLGL